ncbi:MAG: tRNA-dihydrouridine synthase family protein [Oribacterium sp.]|nr:tRNA-dihydrouridine synthase family protein [Oribacterium sp.]
MKFYFAPMEGITGYPFRNAFQQCFPGIDRFYTPFLSANDTFSFTTREKRDTDPALNKVSDLVPQIITNNAEMFVWAIEKMSELGYKEVNLNLGCPSGTVVAKGKGSGMLRYPDRLDAFLEETFELLDKNHISYDSSVNASTSSEKQVSVSVKTRLGIHDPSESDRLIAVYNRYPLSDVIVHSRVQKEFYKGEIHYDHFRKFIEGSKHHLVYNGDIVTKKDFEKVKALFPEIDTVMIGRGLLINPSLIRELNGGEPCTLEEIKAFHEALIESYIPEMGSDANLLYKVKEYWSWLSRSFTDSERYMKDIRKAKNLPEYKAAVRNLMANCKFEPNR